MAENTSKAAPRGAPPSAAGDEVRLAEGAQAIERMSVRLSIHGGVANERFDLDLAASGDGEMKCSLACAVSHRRVDDAAFRVEPRRLADIVEALDVPKLATMTARQGGFPPCSLVGRLDVDLDGESITTFFMADPEQARTAGYEPPAEVMRAVELLYGEAEKGLGMESVRP